MEFITQGQPPDLTQPCFIHLQAPGTVLALAIRQPGSI